MKHGLVSDFLNTYKVSCSYPISIDGSNVDDGGAQGLGLGDGHLVAGQGEDGTAGVLNDIDGHGGSGHSGGGQTVVCSHPQL